MTNPTQGGFAGPKTVYSGRYRIYVLFLLMAVYMSNYADRTIFSVVTGQIKAEFRLSDTEMGFLSGFAFAAVYTLLGIPVAMLADRRSRKTILTVALSLWSLFTALCSLSTSSVTLMLARFGVGFGEAGGGPPAQSIISDYFPPEKRATALAIFSTGVPLGLVVGFVVGGNLAPKYGWRAAFLALAMPGFILAAVAWFTLREPPRGLSDTRLPATEEVPGLLAVLRFMLSQKALVHLLVGATLITLVGTACGQWNVQFLERSHGMSLRDASNYLAIVTGLAMTPGTLVGGWLADVFGQRDRRWNTFIVALFYCIGTPFLLIAYSSRHLWIVKLSLPIPIFVGSMYIGPTFAMFQNLVGVRMRALAAALLLLTINFVGSGLGPLAVGWLSDLLKVKYAQDSLSHSLFSISLLLFWAVFHYLLAGGSIVRGYERASRV